MKSKILFLSLIIVLIIFSGCSKSVVENIETYTCPDGKVVRDINDCVVKTNSNVINDENSDDTNTLSKVFSDEPIEESDVLPFFVSNEFEYVSRTNEPKDVIIKNINNMYQMFGELKYSFSNVNLLDEKKVYIKIATKHVDSRLNKEIYSGELKKGENSIALDAEVTNLNTNPSFIICFDTNPDFDMFSNDAICLRKGYATPKPSMTVSFSSLNFDLNTKEDGNMIEVLKTFTIRNTGDTGQTIYLYYSEDEIVDIIMESKTIFLAPEDKKDIQMTVKYLDDGTMTSDISKHLYVYMIPNNCDLSEECAKTSHLYKKIDIRIME